MAELRQVSNKFCTTGVSFQRRAVRQLSLLLSITFLILNLSAQAAVSSTSGSPIPFGAMNGSMTCESVLSKGFETSKAHVPFENQRLREISWSLGRFKGKVLYLIRKQRSALKFMARFGLDKFPWEDKRKRIDQPGDTLLAATYLPKALQDWFSVSVLKADKTPTQVTKGLRNKRYDDVEVATLPDAYEAVAAMKQLELLAQQRQANFQLMNLQVSEKKSATFEFLSMIGSKGAFPIVSTGDMYLHDFNYHALSALVTPPRLTAAMKSRAELLTQFYLHLLRLANEDSRYADLLYLVQRDILGSAAERFDISGNFFIYALMYPHFEKEQLVVQQFQEHLDYIFAGAETAESYLKALVLKARFLGHNDYDSDPKLQNLFYQAWQDFSPTIDSKFQKKDLSGAWLSDAREVLKESRQQVQFLDQITKDELEKNKNQSH